MCKSLSGLLISAVMVCGAAGSLRAGSVCSASANVEVSQAASCFERWDYACTKLDLRPRISREPQCAEAMWVQSHLSERAGYKDEALTLRRRALAINPRLANEADQTTAHEDPQLLRQDFDHFQARYAQSDDRNKVWDAIKILNESYNSMGSHFGFFPKEKMTVLVVNNRKYLGTWRTRFHGGYFDQRDGVIRLRIDESPGGGVAFEHLARHEFAHAFLHAVGLKPCPMWFQEGVAEFYANRSIDGFWIDNRLSKIRGYTHFKPLNIHGNEKTWQPPLKRVEQDLKGRVGSLGVYHGVLTGEAMVLSVAKDRGESWIPRIVRRMQEGAPFDSAFQEIAGKSPETVLDSFYKSCRWSGNYGR